MDLHRHPGDDLPTNPSDPRGRHDRGFIRKISDSFVSSLSGGSSASRSGSSQSSVYQSADKSHKMMNCMKFLLIVTAVVILLGVACVAGYFTLWSFVGNDHNGVSVATTSSPQYTLEPQLRLPAASNRSIFCHKPKIAPASCPLEKWRSYDGSCNNIDNPLWGASVIPLRRLLPSRYENKIDAPVGWDRNLRYSGFPMPSTRDVSVGVIGAKTVRLDGLVNPFLMSFGQYISHDTGLTRHMRQINPGLTWYPEGSCKDDCSQRVPCFNIPITAKDPRASSGQKCVELIRSVAMCQPSAPEQQKRNLWSRRARANEEDVRRNGSSGGVAAEGDSAEDVVDDEGKRVKRSSYAESHGVPMEQANEVTSFLDASPVYGSNSKIAMSLRGENGTLRVDSTSLFLKGLLPFQPTSKGCTPLFGKEIKRVVDIPCFAAGDGRVNEHLGLIVMHTIFHREHNRIVMELRKVNPHWDGDRLYQEAKNIIAAIHQHVTFNEYLSRTLGPIGMKMVGRYNGYNPLVEPSVSSEFSTAAFRFGHGQIHPIQHRLDENYDEIPQGNLPIRLTFFSPYRIVEEGGIDPLLRGLVGTRGKEMAADSPLSESVTEELWVLTEKHALDLGALNTQRGRDHALRSYLDYRRYCLLSSPSTWDTLTSIMRKDIVTKLEELYGSPENIDLWVGAMLEEAVPGADVGPTFMCMLVEGFRRVRDGDRFWFELPSVMTQDQAKEIKKTSLARIVCDNSDSINKVPTNIFMMTHPDRMTDCNQIQGINFTKWIEDTISTPSTQTLSTLMTTMPTTAPTTMPTL